MEYRDKRSKWLRAVEADKREVVFPPTPNQELERLETLKHPPLTFWAKALYAFMFLCGVAIAFKFYRDDELFAVMATLAVTAILLFGPILALLAWSTHKSLREIRDLKRSRRIRH